MPEKVIIGNAELYCGDCRDILPTLGEVDAIITDPPYGIRFREYKSHIDDPDKYPDLMREVISYGEYLLIDGWFVIFQGAKRIHEIHKWIDGWFVIFQGAKRIHEIHKWIDKPYRLMACAKNFAQIMPGKGPIWSCDFAAFWQVGAVRTDRSKGRDYHVANTANMSTRWNGHPCSRPLDQMMYVVNCFSEHDMTVLDMFMGIGTTGVACADLGRRFVGIEIEKEYFDNACERIAAAQSQTRLFV